ncbi:hypothetical protein C2845_PM02G16380 [Panicum miliaceum]|uniref:Uncharacterized protein n=1 Tax=Panicum miliaceum TaxID=4540 RepID=A0A3L6SA54_PANMI|nr:hypothetical protein C2845_PM02G16380 [Panicum miliaceum]
MARLGSPAQPVSRLSEPSTARKLRRFHGQHCWRRKLIPFDCFRRCRTGSQSADRGDIDAASHHRGFKIHSGHLVIPVNHVLFTRQIEPLRHRRRHPRSVAGVSPLSGVASSCRQADSSICHRLPGTMTRAQTSTSRSPGDEAPGQMQGDYSHCHCTPSMRDRIGP